MTAAPQERPPVVLRDLAPLPGPELAEVEVGQTPVAWSQVRRALTTLLEFQSARTPYDRRWHVEVRFDSQHELMVLVAVRGDAP